MGYQLNSQREVEDMQSNEKKKKVIKKVVGDVFPAYRYLRNTEIHLGGFQTRGSSLTMLHTKVGFPDNRPFKILPGKKHYQVFFSPNIAMANELISTGDASPADFRFFEWATNWLPHQMELEYKNRAWVAVDAPLEVLFPKNSKKEEGEEESVPLWVKLLSSALRNVDSNSSNNSSNGGRGSGSGDESSSLAARTLMAGDEE